MPSGFLTFNFNNFRLVVDPIFPPPIPWKNMRANAIPKNVYLSNRFSLIFDSSKIKNIKQSQAELPLIVASPSDASEDENIKE